MANVHTALGFSMRARKVVCGEFAVKKALSQKKAYVVVVDSQASDASKERWKDLCDRNGVEFICIDGAGHAVGKEGTMAMAIIDEAFAAMAVEADKNKKQ